MPTFNTVIEVIAEEKKAKEEAKRIEDLKKQNEQIEKDIETMRGATCKLSEDITPAGFCKYKCSDGTNVTRPASRGPIIQRYPDGRVLYELKCARKIKLPRRMPKPR